MVEGLKGAGTLDSANTFQQELSRDWGGALSFGGACFMQVCYGANEAKSTVPSCCGSPAPSGSLPGIVGKSYLLSNLNPSC